MSHVSFQAAVIVEAGKDAALLRVLAEAITRHRHADGGWGAEPGAMPDAESTAWALLGSTQLPSLFEHRASAEDWLVREQHEGGSWSAFAVTTAATWPTAMSAWALADSTRNADRRQLAYQWLSGSRGRQSSVVSRVFQRLLEGREGMRIATIDDALTGWPWVDGTASWVEPTSTAILALSAWRESDGSARDRDAALERVFRGVDYLCDRQAAAGGWNYGNTRVLEYELDPFPDTTAWAMLALATGRKVRTAGKQRESAIRAALDRSVPWLTSSIADAPDTSVLTLALAWHAFDACDAPGPKATAGQRLRQALPDTLDYARAGYPVADLRALIASQMVLAERPLLRSPS